MEVQQLCHQVVTAHLHLSGSNLQNQPILQNVSAGNYTVTIKDVNGCTATANVIISNSPPPNVSLLNTTPANCGFSNGAANINVIGGTPPLKFNWNTSPLQPTQNILNVPSGTYIVNRD